MKDPSGQVLKQAEFIMKGKVGWQVSHRKLEPTLQVAQGMAQAKLILKSWYTLSSK